MTETPWTLIRYAGTARGDATTRSHARYEVRLNASNFKEAGET